MMKLSATLRKATVDELAEMLAQKEKENKPDLDVKEEKGEAAETDVVKEENLKSLASPSSIFPSHAQPRVRAPVNSCAPEMDLRKSVTILFAHDA
ncbi:unnamed protein product, partial [Mesorhabditis spiculigera]